MERREELAAAPAHSLRLSFLGIVTDREVTLLQAQLLPGLVEAGIPEAVVRRVMA